MRTSAGVILIALVLAAQGGCGSGGSQGGASEAPVGTPPPGGTPSPSPEPTAWPEVLSLAAAGEVQVLRAVSRGDEIAVAWQEPGSISVARARLGPGSRVDTEVLRGIGLASACGLPEGPGSPDTDDLVFSNPWLTHVDGRLVLAFTMSGHPFVAAELLELPDAIGEGIGCSQRLWQDHTVGQCVSARSGPDGLAAVGGAVALPYVHAAGCVQQTPFRFGAGTTVDGLGVSFPWPGIPDLEPDPPTLARLQTDQMVIGGDGTKALAVGGSANLYPAIVVTEEQAVLGDLSGLVPLSSRGRYVMPEALAVTHFGDGFLLVWADLLTPGASPGIRVARIDAQGRVLDVRPDLRRRTIGTARPGSRPRIDAASRGDVALVTWTAGEPGAPVARAAFVAGDIASLPLDLEQVFGSGPVYSDVAVAAHGDGFMLVAARPDIEVRFVTGGEVPDVSEFPQDPSCLPRSESCRTSADCCEGECGVTPSGFGPVCL